VLQINKKIIDHFITKKFPKRNLGINSEQVVLFFERSMVERYYIVAKRIIEDVCGDRFLGLRFESGGFRIIINFHDKYGYNEVKNFALTKIMSSIFQSEFKRNHQVFLCDYANVAIESKINSDNFLKLCRKIMQSEGRVNLPPTKKSARVKINNLMMKYKTLKVKTIGVFGTRRISIIHKKWKAGQNEKQNAWYYSCSSDKYINTSDFDN
jgi:hypothetical protein